jgi:hypothetical protein
MKARQGMRLYFRVPRTPFTIAAGLMVLNGHEVTLVRRSSLLASKCWVVDPPLVTTFSKGAQAPDGRELPAGHQHQLPAVPEAWLTARAPAWEPDALAFLRESYGTMPTAAIAARLGRGLAATRSKVEDLHLRCRTVWTAELDEILAELFPDTAATALAEVLGATAAAIQQRAMVLGVTKDPAFVSENSRATTLARSKFTPEISEVIELLYPDTLTQDIADFIGMPLERVHAYANHQGWKKTKQFMRDTARDRTGPDHPMRRHQFPKGHVPANKGVKGYDSGGRSHETRFKKGTRNGHAAKNWMPIGSYRINDDGYLERKVSDTGYPPRDWQSAHRLVWIAANGPIPAGHVVRFKDGRHTTEVEKITIDALECITLAENMRRNSFCNNYPPEMVKLIQTRGHMNRMINKRQRALAEERT